MVPETGSQMIEEDVEASKELPDGLRNRQNPQLSPECQSTVKDPYNWHQDQLSYHVQQRDALRKTASDKIPASSLSALPHSTISHPVPDQPRTVSLAENEQSPAMVLQPDSRPISQEHLTREVKTIYAALAMVGSKCIHVDRTLAAAEHDPSSGQQPNLAQDHWQALIALHRTLLYEHHDFFVASQHPSANLELRRLADKHSMPARLWKHGIHSFLEILRHRLPESLEYMLTFVSQAYQTMAILYESVPAFEDTWIECLGDLGRYRMAIEDGDLRGRETWAAVARFWYNKAADRNPAAGRLYHHLAILARPNALQQLYFICRSLTCAQPFMSARKSILILFGPTTSHSNASCSHSSPVETSFIRAHAVMFEKDQGTYGTFDRNLSELLGQLENRIERVTSRWKEQGAYMAIANIASLFDYGSEDNFLRLAFSAQLQSVMREQTEKSDDLDGPFSHLPPMQPVPDDMKLDVRTAANFPLACRLTSSMFHVVLQRSRDKNVLTFVHILLAFLYQLAALPYDTSFVSKHVKLEDIACFLNTLARSETITPAIESPNFLHEGEEDFRPLPEDYLIRGQLWAHSYYPKTWFSGVVDEEERTLELASTIRSRAERILWLGIRLSTQSKFGLKYDSSSHIWCAHR